MPGYDPDTVAPYNDELLSGEKHLNVSATCFVYNCMIRVMN